MIFELVSGSEGVKVASMSELPVESSLTLDTTMLGENSINSNKPPIH